MSEELKKDCPFCGSSSLDCDGHSVNCQSCGSEGPCFFPTPEREKAIEGWNRRANAKTAQEKMVLDYVRRAIACGENISKSFIMDLLAEKPIQKPEKVDSKHDKTTEQIVCGSCLHYDLSLGKCTLTGTTGIMHLMIGCNDWHPIPDDSKPEKVEAKVDKKFFRGTKKWIPNGYAKVVSGIIAETIGWNGLIGGEWMGTCDGEDPSWFEISAADYEAAKNQGIGRWEVSKDKCGHCGKTFPISKMKMGWTRAYYCSEECEICGVSGLHNSMPGGPNPHPKWMPTHIARQIKERWS